MSEPDFQPDVEEVLQIEPTTEPAVKVKVAGPVRTQELPRKAGATFTRGVTNAVPNVPMLRADHWRAKATVIASAAIYIAFSQASAQDFNRTLWWPANLPFYTAAVTEIWVYAQTGTANVSIATEMWATGDGEV
jgi:hypothetical protein